MTTGCDTASSYSCNYEQCDKSYLSEQSLIRHKQQKHDEPKRRQSSINYKDLKNGFKINENEKSVRFQNESGDNVYGCWECYKKEVKKQVNSRNNLCEACEKNIIKHNFSKIDGEFKLTDYQDEKYQYVRYYDDKNRERRGCYLCYTKGIKTRADDDFENGRLCSKCYELSFSEYDDYIDKIHCSEITFKNIRNYLLCPVRREKSKPTKRTYLPEGCTKDTLEQASCSGCLQMLPKDQFHEKISSTNKNPMNISNLCKECTKNYHNENKNNIKQFFNSIYRSMKFHHKNRFKNENFYWTTEKDFLKWAVEKIEQTRGCCEISGFNYTFCKEDKKCISPERKNNKISYNPENLIFICVIFQTTDTKRGKDDAGSAQWSREKFVQLSSLSSVEEETHEQTVEIDKMLKECREDLTMTPGQRIWRKRKGGRAVTPLTIFLQRTLQNAKHRGDDKWVDDFDCFWMLEQFEKTRFRCYYSNIIMNIQTNSDWHASLERIDPTSVYSKSNTVFVCHEFNSFTQCSKEDVDNMIVQSQKNLLLT